MRIQSGNDKGKHRVLARRNSLSYFENQKSSIFFSGSRYGFVINQFMNNAGKIGLPFKKLSMHFFSFLFIILFFSCENDIEKINAMTSDPNYPIATGYNSKFVFSDSAVVQAVLETKEYNYYTKDEDNKYYELPQGFTAYLYDENQVKNYMITAEYGIAYMDKKLWIARNDVVIKDLLKNSQLNTEELYWDQEKEEIYSEKFSKITDKDGVHIGENGFKANQDFSKYELIGAKGTVNVKEED